MAKTAVEILEKEMVSAGREIEYDVTDNEIEYLISVFEINYGIELDDDCELDHDIKSLIKDEVAEWKIALRERCKI